MADFYTNDKRNLHVPIVGTPGKKLTKLQRRTEIIHNLENVIKIEGTKLNGGNRELCEKLQIKLDAMKAK